MGYYPIKCVGCLRTLRMEERCVKLQPDGLRPLDGRFGFSGDRDESDWTEAENSRSAQDWTEAESCRTEQDRTEAENSRSERGRTVRKIRYKSLAELRRDGVIRAEEIQEIKVSPEFSRAEESRENFVRSVTVDGLEIDGKKYSGTIRRFYCPFCHRELLPQAGEMPMYLVGLTGAPSAGKTVYLTILYVMLGGKTIALPQGRLSFKVPDGTGRQYQEYARDIQRKNELPAPARGRGDDPWLMQVSYTAYPESGRVNKQCILALIDMGSEAPWKKRAGEGRERDPRYAGSGDMEAAGSRISPFQDTAGSRISPFQDTAGSKSSPFQGMAGSKISPFQGMTGSGNFRLSEADGYILLVDSENPEEASLHEQEERDGRAGRIRRPAVVVLSKADFLLKHYEQLKIPLSQPVIAPNFHPIPDTDLGKTYYERMDRSVRECLEHLAGDSAGVFMELFARPYFVSVSALGHYVQVSDGKIDNYKNIRPVRVEEPVLRLLMELNFIPRFYHKKFFTDPQFVMRRYGEQFAAVWDRQESGAGEHKEKCKDPEGGSWFRKKAAVVCAVFLAAFVMLAAGYFLHSRDLTKEDRSAKAEVEGEAKSSADEAAENDSSEKENADSADESEKESADSADESKKENTDSADTSKKESADSADASKKESADSADESEKENADSADESEKENADSADASEKESADSEDESKKEDADSAEVSEKSGGKAAPDSSASASAGRSWEGAYSAADQEKKMDAGTWLDKNHMTGLMDASDARYGLYVMDLTNYTYYEIGEALEPLPASALVAVPLMFVIAEGAETGFYDLDSRQVPFIYTFTNGRGNLKQDQNGQLFSLEELLSQALLYSDNNAINSLIDYLTLDRINRICRQYGYESVDIQREIIYGNSPLENYISPRDAAMMVNAIYQNNFSAIDRTFLMDNFRMSPEDSANKGMYPACGDCGTFLNLNGVTQTRYNEVGVVENGEEAFIMAVMTSDGKSGTSAPCVTSEASYVLTNLKAGKR